MCCVVCRIPYLPLLGYSPPLYSVCLACVSVYCISVTSLFSPWFANEQWRVRMECQRSATALQQITFSLVTNCKYITISFCTLNISKTFTLCSHQNSKRVMKHFLHCLHCRARNRDFQTPPSRGTNGVRLTAHLSAYLLPVSG